MGLWMTLWILNYESQYRGRTSNDNDHIFEDNIKWYIRKNIILIWIRSSLYLHLSFFCNVPLFFYYTYTCFYLYSISSFCWPTLIKPNSISRRRSSPRGHVDLRLVLTRRQQWQWQKSMVTTVFLNYGQTVSRSQVCCVSEICFINKVICIIWIRPNNFRPKNVRRKKSFQKWQQRTKRFHPKSSHPKS